MTVANCQTLVVHKFGGAALADANAIRHAAGLVRQNGAASSVVVVSAMAGVTDWLDSTCEAVVDANACIETHLQELRTRHLAAIAPLQGHPEYEDIERDIHRALEALRHLLSHARKNGGPSSGQRAEVLATGERLSARILTAQLNSLGVPARYVDAAEVIATCDDSLNAIPELEATRRRVNSVLEPVLRSGAVPVIPGFVGRGPDGYTTTLGRGGSDLTATILADALGIGEVWLWKDVPGLLSADPRTVPEARLIPAVNIREAAALSRHGSRLLHPRALSILNGSVRVRVRPFGEPGSTGTVISGVETADEMPVKAITALLDMTVVTVRLADGESGARRVAQVMASVANSGVWFVPLATSAADSDSSLLIRSRDEAAVVSAMEGVTDRNGSLSVEVRAGVAAVGVVGPGLGGVTAAAVRALQVLANAGIEVIASGMGRGRDSMTMVVDGESAVAAQRVLHEAFELHLSGGGRVQATSHRDVLLLGAGSIGRALLRQLASMADRLRVVGVVDSTGYVFDPRGLTRHSLSRIVACKERGASLAHLEGARSGSAGDALQEASSHALSRKVLVDATAADTGDLLREAAGRGWDLVLANKLPLTESQESVDELTALLRRHGRVLRHEATVGAGLPVIETIGKLQRSGDTVRRIEGCPSGTLGFLFGQLERGRSFSESLRIAVSLGYTEPDPREDLLGRDVARKGLILGRLLGFRGELHDVSVEPLVPAEFLDLETAVFLSRIAELDEAWNERVRSAHARSCVLRYRLRVTRRRVVAGVVEVSRTESGPQYGTDNRFTFTTIRYREQPLEIAGPGAGAVVTAAGVLDDLLSLGA